MTEAIEIYDERMRELLRSDSALVRLATGAVHSESPVYFEEDDSVVFSDVHGNRLFCWNPQEELKIIREPSDYQNGTCRDLEGRLVACSHGKRAIERREHDGRWQVLVDSYQGLRLNSPNDLVIKSDGTIWFSDPPYGITQSDQGYGGKLEQPSSFVYRFDPNTGEIDAIITEMERPNGIAFSPDETILYVSDTSQFDYPQGHHYIRAYDVIADRWVERGRIFATVDPGEPDGFITDKYGNILTSSKDSVQVYAPDGSHLGKIFVPEVCSNLSFGGQAKDRLFITAGKSLYAIALNTSGL